MNENKDMDIFTKGYVENNLDEQKEELVEEVEKIDIVDTNTNYSSDQEITKNTTSNEEKMKEKMQELMDDFSIQDEIYIKRRKRKNTLLLIGVIIEIVIIGSIIHSSFIKEKYYSTLTCMNSSTDSNGKYDITMKNIYYFDKKDNVLKTENNIIYLFNKKQDYEEYKKNFKSSNIENFEGIEQNDLFDDMNYAYQNKTIYTYSLLKKNKNVKKEDKLLTLNVPNREPITIYIENYNGVLNSNNKAGFTCE